MFNNENETKNYKITGLTILVLFALFVLKNLILSQYSSVSMTSQTFLATEKRALDPAEIEEFYSTISAWRPAACNIPL